MEAYDKEYFNFTIWDIEALTDVRIDRNKRNGRKRDQHIKVMNAIRDVLHPDGEWRNKDGRPSVAQTVRAWREAHPDGKKIDCERDTGLSRHTVLKWWESSPAVVRSGAEGITVQVRPSQELSNILVECFDDPIDYSGETEHNITK